MKKYALILILVLASNCGFSQKKSTRPLPVLFDTVNVDIRYKRKRLEIKDTLFSDSLRIGFKVFIEFKYPLNDTIKKITIKSIRLICLDIKSLSTREEHSIDLYGKTKWSNDQRDIWNRYSRNFNYWYRHQPYEKMIDRKAYGNRAYFGGVLYAMPH